ncbi:MAG: hypothetical protein OXI30_05300 [Chloroflexota bacterium]|nr:hypothetical protein [Chloroflexota bacterium]
MMTRPIGKKDGDDKDSPIVFSEEERREIPKAEETLAILIPISRACCRLLAAAEPGIGDVDAFTHFLQTVDCARQIAEKQSRAGTVDVHVLSADMDIPAIDDTLPLLLEGFERCRSLLEGEDYLTGALVLLSRIASKMYSGMEGRNLILVGGYGDIFASIP